MWTNAFLFPFSLPPPSERGVGQPLNEPGVDGKGLIIRGRHWVVAAPPASAPAAYKALQVRALSLPTTVIAFAALDGATPAQWAAKYRSSASLLSAPLPPNVHLTTTHAHNASTLLLRLSHLCVAAGGTRGQNRIYAPPLDPLSPPRPLPLISHFSPCSYEIGEDSVLSADVTVSLASLLSPLPGGRRIISAVDMTLPGALPLADVPQQTYITDGGAHFTVPVLPAPPTGAELTITLHPMEIRTLLCTLG